MKKYLILAIFLLAIPFFCYGEKLVVTTYYPAPFGVYKELRLVGHNTPAVSCSNKNSGTIYYNSNDKNLYICKGSAEGWVVISSGGGFGGKVIRREKTVPVSSMPSCDPKDSYFNATVKCEDDEILLQCGSSASAGRDWADVDHFDVYHTDNHSTDISGRLFRKDNSCAICFKGNTTGLFDGGMVTVYAFCLKK